MTLLRRWPLRLFFMREVKEKRIRREGKCKDCGILTARKKWPRCRKCSALAMRKNINIDVQTYRRNWAIKKKYGWEPEDFDLYWFAQRGQCAICRKIMKMPTKTRGQGLDIVAIDHDHKTGKVRALLCNACNKGLRFFKDNILLLKSALNYLSE